MKKIISIFIMSAILAMSYESQGQSVFVGTTTNPTRAILNTSADTARYNTTGVYTTITIQAKVTKATGTMAGKVYVYSSPDGNAYTVRDSATLSNSTTQYAVFDFTGGIRQYWYVIQNGATTVTGTLNAKIWGK